MHYSAIYRLVAFSSIMFWLPLPYLGKCIGYQGKTTGKTWMSRILTTWLRAEHLIGVCTCHYCLSITGSAC